MADETIVGRAADTEQDPMLLLTARELEVGALLGRGFENKAIAKALHISVETAKEHVHHCLGKAGCDSRTKFAVWWQLTHVKNVMTTAVDDPRDDEHKQVGTRAARGLEAIERGLLSLASPAMPVPASTC